MMKRVSIGIGVVEFYRIDNPNPFSDEDAEVSFVIIVYDQISLI